MDYFIIAAVSFSGLYFHWWLYRRIRRWTERDLALSMAQGDADKREYMLACLQRPANILLRRLLSTHQLYDHRNLRVSQNILEVGGQQ